jgi:hypothetical protein
MAITHKVHVNEWKNGKLYAHDQYFSSLDAAMAFAHSSDADSVKVFDNHSNQLIHSREHVDPTDSYADGEIYA